MATATAMWHSGKNPLKRVGRDTEAVIIPKGLKVRRLHKAFLRYHDAAGIGGKVGTLLGEWRVNIAHMSVGRGRRGDEAVMALTLDQPLTPAQAADLVLRCGLLYARSVEL